MSNVDYESDLWGWLRSQMTGKWTADRIENRLSGNMPDVVFSLKGAQRALSWMELKVADEMPANKIVQIRHYHQGQKDFLLRYHRAGVPVYLLLYSRLEKQILLFPGLSAQQVGEVTGDSLRALAAFNCYLHSFDATKMIFAMHHHMQALSDGDGN